MIGKPRIYQLAAPVILASGMILLALLLLAGPARADAVPSGPTAAVPAVTGLRVTEFYTDGFTVVWGVVPDVESGRYKIAVHDDLADLSGPALVKDVTPDLATTSYTVKGLRSGATYIVQIWAMAEGANGAVTGRPAQLALTTLADEEVLVAVFFAADNDLAPYVRLIGERLHRGAQANPNARVVYLADGNLDGDTFLWHMIGGTVVTTTAVLDRWGTEELNTADPDVLAWFLEYARAQFPGIRTIVSLLGHGVAMAPELAWVPPAAPGDPVALPTGAIPALPRGLDYTPGDVTNRGYLSLSDLGTALGIASDDGADPFDLVFFDQCFQGNLDTLYEVHDFAKVLIASPNYAWLVAPYHVYLPHFAPAATLEEIAGDIIQIYQRLLTNTNPNAIFWMGGDQVPIIADAVNGLADALQLANSANQTAPILRAAEQSRYVDTTQCGEGNLHLEPPDELLGAESFASNLRTLFGPGDPFGVDAAATALLSALEGVSSTYRVGHPYLEPSELWAYTDTVTLLAPLHPQTSSPVAWRASIYREGSPFSAIWSPEPTMTVIVSQTYAFVQDGRWDDFLAKWYTGPITPTVGEWCNYTPPGVAVSDTALRLAVSARPVAGGVELTWKPPESAIPFDFYEILARKPDGIGQVLVEALESDQLSYLFTSPASGEYELIVAAVDAFGAAQALSAPIVVRATEGTDLWTLYVQTYLPVVQR